MNRILFRFDPQYFQVSLIRARAQCSLLILTGSIVVSRK